MENFTALLGRDPVQADHRKIEELIQGRSILVTGGAGSIGSELCRSLAAFGPERLIVFDRAESDLFRLDLELRERFPDVPVMAEIGDIKEVSRLDRVMQDHRVNIVFHAAAYKHVQLMEVAILEAVRNNVVGTWNVVDSAIRHGVADFVMISSDKAVNPSSVMGATKRAAELIVASADGNGTKLISVRFGNVLGTQGSVVPIFQSQIERGGPVTITHPDMQRYFVSVQEAVQLLLQAFAISEGGQIFVLDMGNPLKVVDLARSLIRSSGKYQERDIAIRVTGVRNGEKLSEELSGRNETLEMTSHPRVKLISGGRVPGERINPWMNALQRALRNQSEAEAVSLMKDLVPEWTPSSHWRSL